MEQLTQEMMDANAAEALRELQHNYTLHDYSLAEVASWWKRHYLKCGHKRLGRILLKFVPEES